MWDSRGGAELFSGAVRPRSIGFQPVRPPMTDVAFEASLPEEAAILRQRAAFNDALEHRNLAAIDDILHSDYLVMPSFSPSCLEKSAILDAYRDYFADPDFVTFVRTAERIVLGSDRIRAAEIGRWVGRWRSESGSARSGVFQAEWRLSGHGWQLMRENYVLLEG